jgi:(4-(4-[2-(gamma-L-glutamylamino)ethyl]phenoxymethyl)furan-2-yl)methanamine synthase
MIARVAESANRFDRVAVTMTAELCDCFATKREGVLAILDAIEAGLDGAPVQVWTLEGRLHPIEHVREHPRLAAAANWLALATVAARLAGPGAGFLVDVGSTTTDIIPLRDGTIAARGRTDTERLRLGELIYAGVRRTPLCALADRLPFQGCATALAAELFATTLDVFLTLGDILDDPDDRSTADGRPATSDAARDRLARMVGADRETFSADDALRLSRSASEVFLARLVEAAGRAGKGRPSVVVVSGSGEFLACRLAARLFSTGGRIVSLSETWGPSASSAACARALLEIVER